MCSLPLPTPSPRSPPPRLNVLYQIFKQDTPIHENIFLISPIQVARWNGGNILYYSLQYKIFPVKFEMHIRRAEPALQDAFFTVLLPRVHTH